MRSAQDALSVLGHMGDFADARTDAADWRSAKSAVQSAESRKLTYYLSCDDIAPAGLPCYNNAPVFREEWETMEMEQR